MTTTEIKPHLLRLITQAAHITIRIHPLELRHKTTIAAEPSSPMTRRVGGLRVTAPPPSQTPSPQPSPPPPQPPTTPTAQSCTTPVTPPLPSPVKKPARHRQSLTHSKNLRWTAIALVEKLSTEHERPSAAVADEVALAASADLRRLHPDRSVTAVERNTRRRVYDALKVMEAAGCIHRDGKSLRWIGVAELARAAARVGDGLDEAEEERAVRAGEMKVEICGRRRRIAKKRGVVREMRDCVDNFERFAEMRRRNRGVGDKLQFPFALIKCEGLPVVKKAEDCVSIKVGGKFKVYSETDVVCFLAERGKLGKRGRKRKVKEVRMPPPPPPSPEREESIEAEKSVTEQEDGDLVEQDDDKVVKPEDEEMFVKEEEEYFEELQEREELKRDIFIHGLHEGVELDPGDPELEVAGKKEEFEQEVELEESS